MSKRRTREQKEKAIHSFTVSWNANENKASQAINPINVKIQNQSPKIPVKITQQQKINTNYSDNLFNLASMKKDLLKSLTFAGLILASELMIYFSTK